MSKQERFIYENHKVNDTLTNDVHSSNRVSVNVLNELHEENEELKKENKAFEHHLSELQGENEILTKENEKLKERVKQLQINNTQRLQNEIEMLKTTIARNEAYIKRMQHQGEWTK